jgi:hypothetical protein
MLYSIGKGSSVTLNIALKPSYPAKPFPLLHATPVGNSGPIRSATGRFLALKKPHEEFGSRVSFWDES